MAVATAGDPQVASVARRAFVGPSIARSFRRARPVFFVLLLPSLLLIGIFSYYPAVKSLIGGFYSWNGFSPPTYVGLAQFRQYVQSPTFGAEMRNTGILVGGSILITLVAQFSAAEIVVHLPRRIGTVAKYLLVLPIVIPPLVVIEIWAYLLLPGTGLIDRAASVFGLPQPTWLSDPHLALLSILLVGFPWISNLGFLIFLGGLQNLPREILEASRVDGSGPLRRVFSIDVPLLLPQFRIVFILSGINAIQNFIPILLLTQGGPGVSTFVPGLDMYQSAFQSEEYGYGMAIGTVIFIAMLIFTLVVMKSLRPRT